MRRVNEDDLRKSLLKVVSPYEGSAFQLYKLFIHPQQRHCARHSCRPLLSCAPALRRISAKRWPRYGSGLPPLSSRRGSKVTFLPFLAVLVLAMPLRQAVDGVDVLFRFACCPQ
jgi:hypothetical protein